MSIAAIAFIPQAKERSSPLIAASGNREVAQLLINNGAIINYKDAVCDNCHYYIAFILLKSVSPQYGKTVLHWASEEGHPEVVKLLVQSHANVNVQKNVSTDSITSLVLLYCKSRNVYC